MDLIVMGQIAGLQMQHKKWADHNFPNQTPSQMVLGICEEAGELAHAQLKREQKIRGFEDMIVYRDAVEDAIGDLFIYMMSFCNTAGIDLEDAVVTTWQRVSQRDWVKFPGNGIDA